MRALVIGCGKSGESAAKLLQRKGYEVFVQDDNVIAAMSLAQKIKAKLHNNITDIVLYNRVIVSPTAFYSAFCKNLLKRNVEIESEMDFAFENSVCKKIAITGSNGKTTVTTLLTEILKTKYGAYAVGNIGLPFSEVCDKLKKEEYAVIEMSSFQLEASKSFHPQMAMLLNLSPDHLNVHRSESEYFSAKKRIFMNLKKGDVAVFNNDDSNTYLQTEATEFFYSLRKKTNGAYLRGQSIFYMDEFIADCDEVSLRGSFNMLNVLSAVTCACIEGVPPCSIRKVLKDFRGLPHRMENCGEINGVEFINDSKATNTDAALNCVKSIKGYIGIIMGGSNKNTDFVPLMNYLKKRNAFVFVYGESADEIKEKADFCGIKFCRKVFSMQDGVYQAYDKLSKIGGSVVLSPACASFDMFRNYADRGEAFKSAVKRLKNVKQR